MPVPVAELVSRLTPDPWRSVGGFSPDLEVAQQRLLHATSDDDRIDALADWLQKHQPCLFGRIAAKGGYLTYCMLTATDLAAPDMAIRDKIQAARTAWTRDGFFGTKNGFIILAISEQIATATPSDNVKELALRLCSLYLLDDAVPDEILHDEIWLEKPGRDAATWKWLAGVNYFCAQGDKRWWQDHRIPGGMAFSVNSVGHMVKSGILNKGMIELERALGAASDDWVDSKVQSLDKALELAMLTIDRASDAVSGRATNLLTLPRNDDGTPVTRCPLSLPKALADRDFATYRGWYHTDVTIPSEYFRPDIERPTDLNAHLLDFTYLFQSGVENPAFTTMAEGRRIRDQGEQERATTASTRRAARMMESEAPLEGNKRLMQAVPEAFRSPR
jgi:hypothetical protein